MVEPRPFTALGEPELEARVAGDLGQIGQSVAEALGPRLALLLLGGGYGRGEGGGTRDASGRWQPYNDYDLIAVVRGVARWRLPRLRDRLATLGRLLQGELGVEVELAPLRQQQLGSLPHTMMWCELFGAHRIVSGDPAVLATVRPQPPERLPLLEGVRYLTNRGALLLWARAEEMPSDRRWKFVHKAWLAVGAAALIGRGQFRAGYSARHELLERLTAEALPPIQGLVERHGEAVAARLRPVPAPNAATLTGRLDEVVNGLLTAWAWLEERRTGRRFESWEEYSCHPGLFAEPWSRWPLLVLLNVRTLGLTAADLPHALREHPRTRVSRALPALLAGNQVPEPVGRLLGRTEGWDATAKRCLSLWHRAN